MARVTIQDCLARVPDHFTLTLIAAKRARQLARGANAMLPWDDHKSTVLALQEVAAGHVTEKVLADPELPAVEPATIEFEPLPP